MNIFKEASEINVRILPVARSSELHVLEITDLNYWQCLK